MSELTSCPEKFSHGTKKKNSKPIVTDKKTSRIYNFLKVIEEMDQQKISQKSGEGTANGPFSSKADYGYIITIDTKSSDFRTLKFFPKLLTPSPLNHCLKKRK